MDIPHFGLGIRFDFFTPTVSEEQISELLSELAAAVPASIASKLMIYGGEVLLDQEKDRGVYTLVFTNGHLKNMRALYRTVENDAKLHGMLCARLPYLQNNVIRSFEGLEYLGAVDKSGRLCGGSRELCFCKKPQNRVRTGSDISIIIAPNSFKGTFGAYEVSRHISAALRSETPYAVLKYVPVADGGDGTLDAVKSMLPGRTRTIEVSAPYGGSVKADYYITDGTTAIIESALASGLALCKDQTLDPKIATSRGTGELIRRALREGASKVLIGLGGSATNDCGIGAACALGFRFLDADGSAVESAADMQRITSIDASDVEPLIKNASFTVMCDVDNPLLGPKGATHTFGRQKGAGDEDIVLLESGMQNMAKRLNGFAGKDIASQNGAGAAGGMGAMLMALLGAEYTSGAEALLEAAHFDRMLEKADVVITGEGSIDGTSLEGKALGAVLTHAAKAGVNSALIAGRRGEGADKAEAISAFAVYCKDASGSMEALDSAAEELAQKIKAAYGR